MATIPASPPPVAGFDAARWLSEWTDNGGIYFLVGDMLHLRRHSPLDMWQQHMLSTLRNELLRSGGGPAIADRLRRLREGDVVT